MNTEITLSNVTLNAFQSHEYSLNLHTRALACHCECLGMNAENSFAICLGKQILYGDDNYLATMQKWGLINEEGKPTI